MKDFVTAKERLHFPSLFERGLVRLSQILLWVFILMALIDVTMR